MLISFAVGVVVVGFIFAGVMLSMRRITSAGFIGIALVVVVAGIAVATLPRVISVAVQAGATTSVNLQLQEVKETVAEAREIKEQIEALVKRIEKGEQEAFQIQEGMKESAQKLAKVEKQQEPRRLSPEQKQTLIKTLAPFSGQKVSVSNVLGDGKGHQFAKDFESVFSEAKWDFGGPPGVDQSIYTKDPVGVGILLSQGDVDAGRIPEAAKVLITTLIQLGILSEETLFKSNEVPDGHIAVQVGH